MTPLFELIPSMSVVVIMAGANDLPHSSTAEVLSDMQELCEKVHATNPSATVVVCGFLPRTRCDFHDGKLTQSYAYHYPIGEMINGIKVVATLPFALHALAALGVMYSPISDNIQMDSLEYWKEGFVNCCRLGPRDGDFSSITALLQAVLVIVAFTAHLSSKLSTRKLGYGVLLVFFVVTQLRHLVFSHGTSVISYLYINIAVYSILVLYNDFLFNFPKKI